MSRGETTPPPGANVGDAAVGCAFLFVYLGVIVALIVFLIYLFSGAG